MWINENAMNTPELPPVLSPAVRLNQRVYLTLPARRRAGAVVVLTLSSRPVHQSHVFTVQRQVPLC